MKKVAIMGPIFTKTYFGGVATFNENLARGFKELGYNVTIFSNQKNSSGMTDSKIKIKSTKDLRREHFNIAIMSLDYVRYAKKIKADKKVYFLHGFFSFAVHGILKTICARTFQRHYVKNCDTVICNSNFTRSINNLYGVDVEHVVHLGVSYDYLKTLRIALNKASQKSIGPKKILYVGRISRTKKLNNIVESMKILKNVKEDEYRLDIIGDGPEKKKIEKFSKENNLNIRFLGKMSQNDIVKHYISSDIFVSMNSSEPFGIVFCEALLAGCKIVCPRSGGQSEILSDYPDRVKMLNDLSPSSIADAIIEMTRTNVASKGIRLNDFSFCNVARKIEEIMTNNEAGSI